ncbi:Phosphatidylinositol alpha-mannosyltransferase [Beutenbergia cavernae DSM 12333]|uniref:D-inositol 3-phosphate glycosyltransferase n=1 Tax=Beutenbergia cavernae (strain ATCC BAA-8 / DSM 12333 / CCUG 43141 / JCM 11478 / NBRC 16432 / NCIMB 13614 / HKI 0122) TaxID=471853 RepID=C5C5P7_BEUC1|nr:glycosyltransferase family 4 protein [Beutenbergia cavernae]ACQ80238.1 Phosphatidylinositol alpha-mannosyltransferase [Beutenbergia cavernae DSM 12333]
MRIGIVCPYSLDAPGGVQVHVRDLAQRLIGLGHDVSVLAPAEDDTPVPEYVEAAGRSVPVRYNGSVARLSFGPVTAARVRRWLDAGAFDVLHIHEPLVPSVSLLALWLASGPIVGTFHTATDRSRAMQVAFPLLRSSLEKIVARIAVSEEARRTLVEHFGGDAVVIPNGVYVDTFSGATVRPEWQGTPERPTIAFLGRTDEPRKGLHVLLEAVPRMLEQRPGTRVLVAGRGDLDALRAAAPDAVEVLGEVDEQGKGDLMASVDVYVAPQTGGESFGIVLVEAMSAGASVVASDLAAFRRVLDSGRAGFLFPTGDPAGLATALLAALDDPAERDRRRAYARDWCHQYDWSVVTDQVLDVYGLALGEGDGHVAQDPLARRMLSRLLGGADDD